MNIIRCIVTGMAILLGCATILLAGCGGSGGDGAADSTADATAANPAAPRLLAGAVQGKPLALTGRTATLAGETLTPSRDGIGKGARFNNPSGVTTDGINLYVADTGNSTIRKVVIATGEVTTLAGSAGITGTADGTGATVRFNRPQAITLAGSSLYVLDTGNNTIRKVVIATGKVTTLAGVAGMSGASPDYFNSPEGIATDGTNLYVADTGSSTIRKVLITTGVVSNLAGAYQLLDSTDGNVYSAKFNHPSAIVCVGNVLYLTDRGNSTIRKIDTLTNEVTTLTDETGEVAKFFQSSGFATDGTNFYVSEFNSNFIYKFEVATGKKTIVAGAESYSAAGHRTYLCGSTDGVGAEARFNGPSGLASDGTNLYIADTGNNLIRKMELASAAVSTLAGGAPGADGIGAMALFDAPTGITTDGTSLYVADSTNNTIRKVEIARARVTTLAGAAGSNGSSDGTGAVARFDSPVGITTDGVNLYVTETTNNTIRKVVIGTGEVTTLAGKARWLGSSDGTGATALFNAPAGITTDSVNLYVADTNNCTIRKMVIATGAVTTLAGSAGVNGSADGSGAAARFDYPTDITTDGTNLYVADTNNNVIRKIVIATGVVTTLAGSAGTTGATDGVGAGASFSYPTGITTDGTTLYVADTINNTIRKVVLADGSVTTLSGNAGTAGATDGTGAQVRFNQPSGITTDGKKLYVADTDNNTIRLLYGTGGDFWVSGSIPQSSKCSICKSNCQDAPDKYDCLSECDLIC